MRKCHYWKKAGRTAVPQNMLLFDCETYPDPNRSNEDGEYHVLRLGVAVAYRLEGIKRTRSAEILFRQSAQFWEFVSSRLSKDRPLWLYAHNMPFDLGAVGGWKVLASDKCEWDTAIFEHGIFFCRGTLEGFPIVLCDSGNYYKCRLATIGRAMGLPKMDMPSFSDSDSLWIPYCRNDVLVLAKGMDTLIQFWRTHELGPWQPTIASLAFSAFRHRFMRTKVLVHDYWDSLRLERAAYYGGRVDTPYIGQVLESPIVEYDYSSLYPSTYLETFPVRYDMFMINPKPYLLKELLTRRSILADVTLRTHDRTYPCRRGARVFHPHGDYRTVLPDAELRVAIESGHVRYVHAVSVHHIDKVFAPYLDFFYPLKEKYGAEDNEAFRTICKYLLNALYGKTGQQTPRWIAWGDDCRRVLERQYGLSEGDLDEYAGRYMPMDGCSGTTTFKGIPESIPIRNYWGEVEVQCGKTESRDSVPAIAATVTSYARLKLTAAQTAAGQGNWYYSDTDSVWVNTRGEQGLIDAGLTGHGEIGRLERKRAFANLTVHGRKDYEAEEIIKIKGIRNPKEPDPDGNYPQLHFPSALSQLRQKLHDGVFLSLVVKHLRRNVDWCIVGENGQTSPLVFPGDDPLPQYAAGV